MQDLGEQIDETQFTVEDVALSSMPAHPLNLKPQFMKVSPWPTPTSQRLPGGWNEDTLTKDYEEFAQQLIKFAISDFHSQLVSNYAYPDHVTQVSWVKEAWKEGCKHYKIEMGFNNEIIKMIMLCTSHLTGKVKAKLQPLVKSVYGFESSTRELVGSRNHHLVQKLKHKFSLCYHDLRDEKTNVPHSGVFRTKLTQKAVNVVWYHNTKDKGIIFRHYFTPFPIPAMALLYTVAECCIDKWANGECIDITFSEDKYKETYDKHITNLKKFATLTKEHGILDTIQKDINNSGQLHAKAEPLKVGDGECLSDDEIRNAIQEFQEGSTGGGNVSEDEDESDVQSKEELMHYNE
ncbi:uncharacterized protein BJ212DRAFT_1476644 [Suillus subaureus]|uniref:DUF6532 domain-containing protein n=1 Tax=Suillus subaureus TaxID=48587 RepID=A0A9P7JHR0_9AGAM|nr:uncharacterized protein BJ212DRAFT_1476644 [Suillus subaureus]KAG1823781.1 hypothetical protein BJ212DRAFT_1476644 [Suillus subaureus]